MKTNFLRHFFTAVLLAATTLANAANVNVTTSITASTTWTNNNTYTLFGDIIVKNGATLTIEKGTLVKGNKTTLSRLVVAAGAKLIAQGTAEEPIVFTSSQPVGSRSRADWAGIAICGLAPINSKDANGNSIQGRIECGTDADYDYGGTNLDDSSGVISYVRIEYAGYVCGSNTELNSLTMGGVGRKTKIDHVMISYGQDDGFEWFGGNVNCSELISFGARDDDFDTDFGYSGKVQNGLIIRLDTVADQGDVSNAFESDNDANGTYNTPYTGAVFSNISVIGPAATKTSVIDSKYGWALRIRRNSSISIFNSLFIGYKRGLRLEGAGTQAKATGDTLEFKNNIIAGYVEQYYESTFDSLYLLANPSNSIFGGNANDSVKLGSPYGNPANYNFLPQAGSPALSGASFSSTKLNGFATTTHRGAFGTNDWTKCWAEFTPQDEVYTTGPINYTPNVTITQTGQLPSLTLTASNIAGATYSWSTGDNTAATTVIAEGTFTLTVTNARGCEKVETVTVTSTSVKNVENTIQNIRLFPNPNNGLATLEVFTAKNTSATISVLDMTGRVLTQINTEINSGSNQVELNTSTFAAGLYLVNVNIGAEQKIVRMSVSK